MRSKFKWIFTLLLAFSMQFSFAQEKTVTGVVSDKTGPIPGANVVVKGTTRSTQTDFDGKFSIKAKAGEVLLISFVGMSDKAVTVGAANNYSVTLADGVALDEVVVQGYRTTTKSRSVIAEQTVDSKTIENRPNANVLNTLQGQLAGVNITASTGQPGARSSVVIRGIGTFNGNNDPLYVIDGFPTNADNFRSINPNDIESVTVLKDASATSQYGNRGTNGVILITTKRPALGGSKTSFRYSSTYGLAVLQTPKYDYANTNEQLRIERAFGLGRGAGLTDEEINAITTDTDWVDVFFRPANTVNHNFSFETSSENMSSFTSIGYTDQDGILDTTGLQRFNFRNNTGGKTADGKFTYQVATGFGYSKNNEATNLGEGAINRNYVLGAFLSLPYYSPDEYQGSVWTLDLFNNTPGLEATPFMLIDKLKKYANLTEEARFDVATEFAYKLSNDFTIRTRLNGLLQTNRFFQSEFPDSFNALLFSSTQGIPTFEGGNFNGFEDINNRREFNFNNLYQLEYNKQFGKHKINASLNYEYNHARINTDNQRQRGLDPIFFVPNTGAGYVADNAANDFYGPVASASNIRTDLLSYFALVDYDFDGKYGISGTIRRDGSSRFAAQYRWGNFWSVGARWNLDKEAFMDNVNFIDVLKLRASIGTTGNQRIVDGTAFAGVQPPLFIDSFALGNNAYNGQQGYNFNFAFPRTQWETTEQFNIGLDFDMFKKLRGSIEFYNRTTVDSYISIPTSASFGTDTVRGNSDADLTNRGLELNLAYDLVKNDNLQFTVRLNGSYNKNSVDGILTNNGRIVTTDTAGYTFITQNGGSLQEAFVYDYIGVNPANGNLLFADVNGNPTENPTSVDRKATGKNFIPTYQGGFGFDFEYKGFFASTTFTYVLDTWRFDQDEENLFDVANIGQFVNSSQMLNAWTPTNTNTNVPSLDATNLPATGDSDRFLRDASYLRLRNAQVGYRLPSKYLSKTFISSLAFTLQGENLFTVTKWKGFDAESNRTSDFYQYPTPRIYTFGIDVKF
ncbi:SusC/RagA family TonB-linked outer membrane protein [Flavobacterium sp. j3]|uniref:SusC/RagA family TonB-linked outer membrane protein n=1 Tax=Flavobacterium aureirubrum TaxID=3133147 RepID=A0ABU9N0D4_9FLAO